MGEGLEEEEWDTKPMLAVNGIDWLNNWIANRIWFICSGKVKPWRPADADYPSKSGDLG